MRDQYEDEIWSDPVYDRPHGVCRVKAVLGFFSGLGVGIMLLMLVLVIS